MSVKIRLNKAYAANFTNREKAVYHLSRKLKFRQTLFLVIGICVVVYITYLGIQIQLPDDVILAGQKQHTFIEVAYDIKNKVLHKVQLLIQIYL
jgi:hypothetical protein